MSCNTHSDGLPLLPCGPVLVIVEELFDDTGTTVYAIKIKTPSGELTVGRRGTEYMALAAADLLRSALPGV